MRRLRVAYVPAVLNPGGAERQMLALAKGLPKDTFEISILVLSGPGAYDDLGNATGAHVQFVGPTSAPDAGLPARVWRRVQKTGSFVAQARAGRFDIVDAWLYPSDVLAALTSPITRIPIVISGRRNLDPHDQFGRAGSWVDSAALRMTDMVVANSSAAAAYAVEHQRVAPDKITIIRNGVYRNPPLDREQRRAIRLGLGIGQNEVLIGCVANYLPVKRHATLIDAFETVVERYPAARLVLVGEGPMRPEMEGQVRSLGLEAHVLLLGSVEDPSMIIGAFDVVVQASRSEGLPNSLLEAAAAGRAIVATSVGGTGEIIVDGESGLLVPAEDPEALASALIAILQDEDLRHRVGAAARDRAEAFFGMDRFVNEFAQMYLGLATARRLLG